MHQLTQKEMLGYLLEMMKEVKNVCNKLNIDFFLYYGTLLGAVRHKGFIPWDDDIDLAMFRDEYDIFVEKFNEVSSPNYFLRYCDNTKDYPWGFAKIYDLSTTKSKKEITPKYEDGLNIDIFPLDYVNNLNPQELEIDNKIIMENYRKEMISYTRFLRWRTKYKGICNLFVYHGKGKFKYLTIDHSLIGKAQNDYLRNASNGKKTDYVRLGLYPKEARMLYKVEWLSKTLMVPFENEEMPIPIGYDNILKVDYGDYMALPPPKERVNKHIDKLYSKN